MATLERLLARAEADRAYLQPWIRQTAERLEAVGGWAGLDSQAQQEKAAQAFDIALEGGTAAVIDNVLEPSFCRDLVDKHLQVGLTSQEAIDKLKKEAELKAVGREGVAAALRDSYRLRRELGIQYSFIEAGLNTSEALTVESPQLADLLWQRICPFIPPTLQEQGATALVPGTYHAQGIIPIFRFMRYTAGQGFRPHHDPVRLLRRHPRTKERGTFCSLITVALYLNAADEMDGGALSFLRRVAGKAKGSAFESIATVEPAVGRAVVFPHKQLHEGGELRGGEKHMCQCDVLYRRAEDGKK